MFDLQQLFYGVIIPFITFFGLFAFVIYPNATALHPTRAPPDCNAVSDIRRVHAAASMVWFRCCKAVLVVQLRAVCCACTA